MNPETLTATVLSSRPLTQEEIEGYDRFHIQSQLISALLGEPNCRQITLRFLVKLQNYTLVTLESTGTGEFTMHIGAKGYYSYKLSDVVNLLDQLFEKGCHFIPLKDEVQFQS